MNSVTRVAIVEITKGAAQTDREFERDLVDYKELWLEKLSGDGEIIA